MRRLKISSVINVSEHDRFRRFNLFFRVKKLYDITGSKQNLEINFRVSYFPTTFRKLLCMWKKIGVECICLKSAVQV